MKSAAFAGCGIALKELDGFAARHQAGDTHEVTVADLPVGSSPAALQFRHFPSRLHAFVWRNWPLVPIARMAEVVGADTSDIERMGKAMGLGKPPRITEDQQARSYITVIKRNWHLLPYDQLIALLGWAPAQLAYTLREDDFLFVKLGNLKPACLPLRYARPGPEVLSKEQEIVSLLRETFPAGASQSNQPLFGFVSELSHQSLARDGRNAGGDLRFCYSYFALYGDPLLDTKADPYPDGYLARLAELGVNGVWLQAVLYKLAPFPWQPNLGASSQRRLSNLNRLVQRAARYGIKIFLYLNEPRAMPLGFFESHGELKGASEADHAALCTSVPDVQRYLVDSITHVCTAVPHLGGFFSITASENFTNCWSHGGGGHCPRCGRRSAGEVIAELNSLFLQGIRTSKTAARLIAWDWGWDDSWAGEAIRRLPDGVTLMSVSEWRLPIERGGIKSEVGEYSISAIGPGPRALSHWSLAQQRGLKTVAKIQAGNTWELSSVPYIPAMENVARHAQNLSRTGVKELMVGWTLGGYPSPNLEVVAETLAGGSAEEGLQRIAGRRFGALLAPLVVAAWKRFSAAFGEFPYHVGVVYSGPQQLGPANLLWDEPTGYRATMVGFPYDDLENWRAIYPPNIFAAQFEKVAAGFENALAELRTAAQPCLHQVDRDMQSAFQSECNVAEAAGIHFRSTANQARFVIARRAAAAATTAQERQTARGEMKGILVREISLARRLHELQSNDSRLGFEASNHYFYVPIDLAEKVLNCHDLLARV